MRRWHFFEKKKIEEGFFFFFCGKYINAELSINQTLSHFYFLISGRDYVHVLFFEKEDWSICIYIPNYAD